MGVAMSDVRLLIVSAPVDAAAELVRQLCEERLVACGNIIPGVRSLFRWEGEVCDEAETLVVMETVADRLQAAMDRIAELHSYDVPKILALAPEAVLASYENWAKAETRPKS